MISVKDLTKRYGSVTAVGGITFEVRPREVMGFLGPNGAGKSTTLRILSGFISPTSGSAVVAGLDLARSSLELRRRIGYLPENNPLYEDMEVSEYLEWTAQVRALRASRLSARLRATVESCGLGDVLSKQIGILSKGYRQRVGFAAAILHDPEILLLDEPTSGLDPNQAREVRALISRLKTEKTVLLSTHILSEVEASCDRVVILHKGRISASGTPRELLLQAAGTTSLRLALKRDGINSAAVRSALEKLPGAESVEISETDAELSALLRTERSAQDLRETVFRLAVESGWTLLELSVDHASLESVFRELTPS